MLAAGFGTRLLPLTREVPKPLLPLWGRTLLDRALDTLAGFGVREVLINLHHGADRILTHFEKNPRVDIQLQFSVEPEILGTGGALVRAHAFLPESEPFWLFNADVVASLDPQPLLKDFARHQPLATLWLEPRLGPRTVEMRGGRILNLTSPRAGGAGLFTFTGLHLLTRRILDFLPPREEFASMTPTYAAAMSCGERVRGIALSDAYWMDLGTPVDYLAAHDRVRALPQLGKHGGELFDPAVARRALSPGKIRSEGFVALAAGVGLPPTTRLKCCVVMAGVRFAPKLRIESAVIGPDTVVSRNVTGLVGRAERWLDSAELKAVCKLGYVPEETTIATSGVRGSQRSFTRLISGERTAILIRYDPDREENKLYVRQARFLKKHAVPVPEVLLDEPRKHLSIVEDLGDISLSHLRKTKHPQNLLSLYEDVLRMVFLFHRECTHGAVGARLPLMPAFGPDLYRWECDYFAEHMLAHRCGVSEAKIARIKQELTRIPPRLHRAPHGIIHRDLQSSNILWHKGQFHLIDFQGMRWGPVVYDLASLLCDPYVDLPEEVQLHLVKFYGEHAGQPAVLKSFWWAATQRLVQALGAFAKLSLRPEGAAFSAHIPAALRQLKRSLQHNPHFPELEAWTDQAQRVFP